MHVDLAPFLLSLAVGGLAVYVVSRLVSGFKIRGGLLSCMLVGAVYGGLKYLLQTLLIILALPLVVLSLGLFIVIINAFLLWLTQKLLSRLEIRSTWALLVSTVLLSLFDLLLMLVVKNGALF